MEIALLFTSWFSVFRRISPDVMDQFLHFFHYMKALYVLMMDLYLIFQFVRGRCHGNLVMKVNRYYVHSLQVRQMEARFRFATTCY